MDDYFKGMTLRERVDWFSQQLDDVIEGICEDVKTGEIDIESAREMLYNLGCTQRHFELLFPDV